MHITRRTFLHVLSAVRKLLYTSVFVWSADQTCWPGTLREACTCESAAAALLSGHRRRSCRASAIGVDCGLTLSHWL